ncbi:MAG: transglutaminase-like domain-containing protein [Bacteroidales bacterium]|nr:transglutaminase-like domain-containing protein [Bacteroidales bacterium]
MYRVWKRLFIVATILLVSCSAFGGYLWYQLNVTKNQLANTEVQLANTVVELDNTKVQLADTETLLDTTKTKLVDTEAQLGTTKAQLDVIKTQLDLIKAQLETAKNENIQMLNQYAGLKGQIDIRLALTPQDSQSFITPSNSAVSEKVQEITGGYSGDVNKYWRDCERLYRWVVKNISYSYDSYMPVLPGTISGELIWHEECWRMPEETLGDKTGDCEDMAVLLASMLRSYNEGEYAIWALKIRSSVPEVTGHVAVAFPVAGGNLTILDPAGNYYTGYQYGSLRSESASVAVNNWLSHWNRDMPGAEIVTAFSENSYHQFSSTAEFLTWLEE